LTFTRQDPATQDRWYNFFDYLHSAKLGRAPGWAFLQALGEYMLPDFHPGTPEALAKANAYLDRSTAVRASAL
jgi:predicted metal-dependent hydrolase